MDIYAPRFSHERPFTIGVEEEYMLCDPKTGQLVDFANEILQELSIEERERFSYELILGEIEINTPISGSVDEAMDNICHYRARVRDIGQKHGYRMGISGTHPTAIADEQTFVDSVGYQWVAEQLLYYASRNITFALHVHVALPDADSAIAVTNAARRWLGPLLALSTNSPYFQSHDTGMLSARTFQFGAFPRTNIPSTFRSFKHFTDVLNQYRAMESINLPRQIWWKIRPHGHYGTVEFRVCDIQRSLDRTRMLVALSQAICHRINVEDKAGKLVQDMEIEFINDAIWKATRFGFDAKVTDVDGTILTMGELIQKMAEYVRPSLEELGALDIVPTIEKVLAEGSEANQQREIYDEGGFPALLRMLMDDVEF